MLHPKDFIFIQGFAEHAALWPNPLHFHLRAISMQSLAGEGLFAVHSLPLWPLTILLPGRVIQPGRVDYPRISQGRVLQSLSVSVINVLLAPASIRLNLLLVSSTLAVPTLSLHMKFTRLRITTPISYGMLDWANFIINQCAISLPVNIESDHTLDKCPICLSTKCTKAWRSKENS